MITISWTFFLLWTSYLSWNNDKTVKESIARFLFVGLIQAILTGLWEVLP